MDDMIRNERLAVLIDAENISYAAIDDIFSEIASFGTACIKRAYGDWKELNEKWKEILLKHGIKAEQNFHFTQNKNSSDIAFVIEAMDLLHAKNLDGFCIVSSDSDFTHLARRIRESGLKVYGFGEGKTPEALTNACDKFIFIENLRNDINSQSDSEVQLGKDKQDKLHRIFQEAIQTLNPDDELVSLANLGNRIVAKYPSFDVRSYGFKGLGKLVAKLPFLELIEIPEKSKGAAKAYNVKLTRKTFKK